MTPAFLSRLKPGQSRALAVALAVAAVAAVAALVLVPTLLLHKRYDTAIEELTDRLVRYRRVAAQAGELAKAVEAVRARDSRRHYLRNTAPNLASAELSEAVKAAIEGNGGRITTSQNAPPRDDEAFKLVGANIQFFATTANLQKILAALETQQPYVVVANVTVRPVNAFRGFKPAPGQDPELVVQVDAVAWAFPEAARPAAAAAAPKPPQKS
ncbi:MAG: type II secretion system protein GspM [Betaproteobacteria bacterium]|nr:type II secretion system protein GspM [Betaproteobacteria bacterium]